ITTGMLSVADQAVATGPLSNGGVDTAQLADGAVTTPKLADGAVTLAKMAPGVIDPALSPGALNSYYLHTLSSLTGSYTTSSQGVVATNLYGSPIYVPKDTTVDRIGYNVT